MEKKTLLLILGLIVSIIFFPVWVTEQARAENNYDGLAVALIIDSSGSMKENDPNRVRIEAAQKTVELMGSDDQVTVVEFADRATVAVPLSGLSEADAQSVIYNKLIVIQDRGYTDIKGGLENAYQQLSSAGKGKKKFALLLSDGEPDLPQLSSPAMKAEYMAGINKIAGQYKEAGWVVHCIALHREEAGPLLKQIAQQTGGEYFFVKDASELIAFFQSIMLVQKHSALEMPELAYKYEAGKYAVGDAVPVRAGFKLGSDYLAAGPHLALERMELLISYQGTEPRIVKLLDDGSAPAADEKAGDGIYSALVDFDREGDVVLTLLAEGLYRGQKISEEVELQQLSVGTRFSLANWVGQHRQYLYLAGLIAGGTTLVLIALLLLRRLLKKRAASIVNGRLLIRTGVNGGELAVQELDLSKMGKSEVLISSDKATDPDIFLPVIKRDFAFTVKKMYKIYNVINCLPGTFLVAEGIPKSRLQIFHGSIFDVGGYTFEFDSLEAPVKAGQTDDQQVSEPVV